MSNRFVHAADLHLDSPFRGVGRFREGLDLQLREASLTAWDRLVDLCLDEHAAFLLIAGDLFNSDQRSPRAERSVRQGLERLVAAGIPTLIVHGNHDPFGQGTSYGRVDGVTVFRAGRPQTVALAVADGSTVTVHGVSFGRRAEPDNLAVQFVRGEQPGLHIGLLHCMAGASEGHDPYAPCSVQDLIAAKMDYWALGHVHEPQVLNEDPPIVYAGTTQGRSPRPGERGPRGAFVVEFDGTTIQERRFVALDSVRFAHVDVSIDGCEDLDELEQRLVHAAEAALVASDGRLVLLRATLTGRSSLHRRLAGDGVCESLRVALDGDADANFVWERIENATGAEIDVEALRGSDAIAGDVIAMADEIARDPDALAALLLDWEESVRDSAARGVSLSDPAARLLAARDRTLEILVDGEVGE